MQTIRGRLQFAIGAPLLVLIVAGSIGLSERQRAATLDAFRSELETEARSLALAIGVALEHHDFSSIQRVLDFARTEADLVSIEIARSDGTLLAAYPERRPGERVDVEEGTRVGKDEIRSVASVFIEGERRNLLVLRKSRESLDAAAARMRMEAIMVGLTALVLSGVWLRRTSRRIAAPIQSISSQAASVAEGRLAPFDSARGDSEEVERLVDSFRVMIDGLRDLVLRVRGNADSVRGVAGRLTRSAAAMGEGSRRQRVVVGEAAESVSRVVRAAEGVTGLVDRLAAEATHSATLIRELDRSADSISNDMDALADSLESASRGCLDADERVESIAGAMSSLEQGARDAHDMLANLERSVSGVAELAERTGALSREARKEADVGIASVHRNDEAMTRVRAGFDSIDEHVDRLAHASKDVSSSLSVIKAISDQSALLALNASIIAARAGEHGRAFAVVAEEVGKLARHTDAAATEIEGSLETFGVEMDAAVGAVQSGSAAVDEGLESSGMVSRSLTRIGEKVSDAAEAIRSIEREGASQVGGLRALVDSFDRVRELARSSHEGAREHRLHSSSIAEAMEQIREAGEQARASVSGQGERGRRLAVVAQEIASGVDEILRASREQSDQSAAIEVALDGLRALADDVEQRSMDVRSAVELLETESDELTRSLEGFET